MTEKTPTTRRRRRRRERNLKMNMRIMRMTGIPKNIKGTMMIMRRNQAARKVRRPMKGMMITTENYHILNYVNFCFTINFTTSVL